MVLKVILVNKVLKVLLEQLALWVPQGLKVPRVLKEIPVLKAPLVQQVHRV